MPFRFHRDMPLPGTRAAPIFDDRDHRTLVSFFDNLDDLFARHSITDDQDRKQYVLRYFPLRESDMCETLDEFDAPTPYSDFVAAIIALYPGITRSDMTLSTLHELIEMRRATPIQSCEELATFYREFLACSSALWKNGRLATFERTPLFVKALRKDLATRIRFRLEILQPDRAPDHVFDLETVYQAALFILRGSPEISKLDQTGSTAPGESPSIVATLHRALESLEKITAPLVVRSCESRPRPASVAPQPPTVHQRPRVRCYDIVQHSSITQQLSAPIALQRTRSTRIQLAPSRIYRDRVLLVLRFSVSRAFHTPRLVRQMLMCPCIAQSPSRLEHFTELCLTSERADPSPRTRNQGTPPCCCSEERVRAPLTDIADTIATAIDTTGDC